MAIPFAPIVVVVGVAAGAFGFYQIRATVESVEEVFTSPDSFLNSFGGKAIIGAGVTAGAAYILTNLLKGMK